MALPDPRRYGSGLEEGGAFAACARAVAGAAEARADCVLRLRRELAAGNDEPILNMLRTAPSAGAYRALFELVTHAVDAPDSTAPEAIATRVFALPVILVAAAQAPTTLPGALPDAGAVHALLERHGVLGATRNFGLSNGLCSLEALEALTPATVYGWLHAPGSAAARDLDAPPISVAGRPEQVHLRFLVGAGVSAVSAPSLDETAGTIGVWGMPLAREIGKQLARPGLELLAIPRAPATILRAAHLGRHAQLELAFNLFASNTLRTFRSATGDPAVVISAHRLEDCGAELRVSVSSRVDDGALEGFRWPLHPLDDLSAIERAISGFLDDARVSDVHTIDTVLPERLDRGGAFVPIARLGQLSSGGAAH